MLKNLSLKKHLRARKLFSKGESLAMALVAGSVGLIVAAGMMAEMKSLFKAKDEVSALSELKNLREMLPKVVDCQVTYGQCGDDEIAARKRVNIHNAEYRNFNADSYDYKKTVVLASMNENWNNDNLQKPGWKARFLRVRSMCMDDGILLQYQTKQLSKMQKTQKEMDDYETAGASTDGRWANVFGEGNLLCSGTRPAKQQETVEDTPFTESKLLNLGSMGFPSPHPANSNPRTTYSFTPTRDYAAFTISGVLKTRGDQANCGLYVYATQNGVRVYGDHNGNQRQYFTYFEWHDKDWTAWFGFSRRAVFNTLPNVPVKIFIESQSSNQRADGKFHCWLGNNSDDKDFYPIIEVEK